MEKNKEQELLKSVADVLDEALAVYDELQKGDGSFPNVSNVDDMKGQGKAIVGEGTGPKPAMAKEDEMKPEMLADKGKDKDKEDEEEEEGDEDSDEKLEMAYKSLVAKMEKRGMMNKTVQKSEAAPAGDESLRKSVDERFENLNKAIKEVSETVKKIASQPAPRKGVTGQSPLKKSEGEGESLKKSEVIEKLFELRKSGDKRVDTLLINRIETNRHSAADVQTLRALNILK